MNLLTNRNLLVSYSNCNIKCEIWRKTNI